DGFGSRTTVEYESLAITDRYDAINYDAAKASDQSVFCASDPSELHEEICGFNDLYVSSSPNLYQALNQEWDLPAGSQTLGRFKPVLEYSAPTYVVTSLQSSAPAVELDGQNQPFVNTNAVSRISYHYAEAKMQAAGRGLLGFERLRTVDQQSGVVTTTRYRQDWPFIGYPIATETRTSEGSLLGKSETQYEILEYATVASQSGGAANISDYAASNGTAGFGPLQIVTTESESFSYDFVANGAQNGALLTHSKTETTDFDVEGNPKRILVTDYDASGTILRTVESTNTYFDESVFPLLWARLKTAVVETIRPAYSGPGETEKRSEFTYFQTPDHFGMLASESVQVTGNSALNVLTEHDYDDFGNLHKSKAITVDGTRCDAVTAEFDASGRYTDVARDCLGRKTSEVMARNNLGEPTEVRSYTNTAGTNYVTTNIAYGALGREYFRKSTYGDATSSYLDTNTANCPAGTNYRELVSANGGREAITCFDVLGRPTRQLARSFDGSWVASDTQYDESGRKKRFSEPFFLSAGASHWTDITFDRLGRPTSTALPDGSSGSMVYSGFTAETINDLGQSKTEHRDALGDLVKVVDNLGGETTFNYDHHGNMVSMTDNAGNATVIGYDIYGQKQTMNDPDKGYWTYDYNGFGDLVSQTNANGHTTKMTYDGLGRMVTRIDCINTAAQNCNSNAPLESSTTWIYDTGANALGQLVSVEDTVSTYFRAIDYDSLGRPSIVTTNFDGRLFNEKTTYDEYGRVFQVFDAAGDGSWTDNAIRNRYNAFGFLSAIEDAVQVGGAPRTVYRTITAMDARAQVESEVLGNDVITSRNYEQSTGRLRTIVSSGAAGNVQNLEYLWDTVGNLTWRKDKSAGKDLEETFLYDGLNRLRQQTVTGSSPVVITYDDAHLGNIKSKSDVGTYDYLGNKPHAPSAIAGAAFTYDANGNNLTGDGRDIKYTTFDKPYEIKKGSDQIDFAYSPDRSRFKRVDTTPDGPKVTRYIGSVEVITLPNGNELRKRYIAGVAIETSTYQNYGATLIDQSTLYSHKDHLGSMDVFTDESGQVAQTMSFDPWGHRRNGNWQLFAGALLTDFDSSITTRGFTGHEMLDSVGIIHMNGRIYDPRIGRFLQADPFVQDPTNGQSLNRYAYVWNNPLNATDPSGYFVGALFGQILTQAVFRVLPQQLHAPLTAFASAAAMASGCVPCAAGIAAAGAAHSTYAITGDLGMALKAGAFAGVSALAFSQVGAAFGDGGSLSGLTGLDRVLAQATLHGMLGGVIAVLQGGDFGHGFVSSAFAKAASVGAEALGLPMEGEFAAAVLIGGTASKLSGGKFANGAVSAAMGFIFNRMSVFERIANKATDEQIGAVIESEIVKTYVDTDGNLRFSKDFKAVVIAVDEAGNVTVTG
ncbi:MAG: RHS repeat-associated core domain-containing protein, partial [Pseudomonadota bacterium]